MGHLGSAAKPVGQGVRPLGRNSAAAVMTYRLLLVAGDSAAVPAGRQVAGLLWPQSWASLAPNGRGAELVSTPGSHSSVSDSPWVHPQDLSKRVHRTGSGSILFCRV